MITRPGELPMLEALDWFVLGAAVVAVVILLRETARPDETGE